MERDLTIVDRWVPLVGSIMSSSLGAYYLFISAEIVWNVVTYFITESRSMHRLHLLDVRSAGLNLVSH